MVVTKNIANPKLLRPGFYLIKPYNIVIYVRGTDDFYYALPRREGSVHDFIVSVLKEGDVFVDVGANIGYYTILGSKLVGSKGLVIAVEPVPDTVKILRFNLRLNDIKNVLVIDKAAWSKHE